MQIWLQLHKKPIPNTPSIQKRYQQTGSSKNPNKLKEHFVIVNNISDISFFNFSKKKNWWFLKFSKKLADLLANTTGRVYRSKFVNEPKCVKFSQFTKVFLRRRFFKTFLFVFTFQIGETDISLTFNPSLIHASKFQKVLYVILESFVVGKNSQGFLCYNIITSIVCVVSIQMVLYV